VSPTPRRWRGLSEHQSVVETGRAEPCLRTSLDLYILRGRPVGIEDPAIWIAVGGVVSSAAGFACKVRLEKIRAKSRKENLDRALQDVKPADRPKIIEAMVRYERPAVEAAPITDSVTEIASSVVQRARGAIEGKARGGHFR
jgi:hypothetical protein